MTGQEFREKMRPFMGLRRNWTEEDWLATDKIKHEYSNGLYWMCECRDCTIERVQKGEATKHEQRLYGEVNI